MRQFVFSYVANKLKSAFESSEWQDSVGESFRANELNCVCNELRKCDQLADEIDTWIRNVEQLLRE